jgi:hypothetical protein
MATSSTKAAKFGKFTTKGLVNALAFGDMKVDEMQRQIKVKMAAEIRLTTIALLMVQAEREPHRKNLTKLRHNLE